MRHKKGLKAYEIRASGNLITGNDSSPDPGEELLPRDNLLAHEMTASLGLHLILNVHSSNTSPVVLLYGAGNVDGTTEAGENIKGLLRVRRKPAYPVSASAITGIVGSRLQIIWALCKPC